MTTLTWETVRAVRALGPDRSLTYAEIGARFGITGNRVANLLSGYSWKDKSFTPCLRSRAKLDWPTVRLIRARYSAGETGPALAATFGVSHVAIHFIVTGRNWRNDPLGFSYSPVRKGRGAMPKISPAQAEEIVQSRRSIATLACDFGVSEVTIYRVLKEHKLEAAA